MGGIVHDESQTGATLFIEPPMAIELTNELRGLEREEAREIHHILGFERSHGFGILSLSVFDVLGFIRNDALEIDRLKDLNIISKGDVGGNDNVVCCEKFSILIA